MVDFIVKEYDADQIKIVFAGYPISRGAGQTGYGDGEFLTATQSDDSFLDYQGTDGLVTRAKSNARLIDYVLTLVQTSPANDFLSQLLASDENQPGGAGIASFLVQDNQGTTKLLSTFAWVKKPADITYDRAVQVRKWPIRGVKSVWNVGSN
jgi:hypothetical protein